METHVPAFRSDRLVDVHVVNTVFGMFSVVYPNVKRKRKKKKCGKLTSNAVQSVINISYVFVRVPAVVIFNSVAPQRWICYLQFAVFRSIIIFIIF